VAKRERYLFVCTNSRPHGTPKGSCGTRGAVELHAALKAEINARGMSGTQVRACTASCLDVCWAGPAILVAPDNLVLGRVTTNDVASIVDALAKEHLEHPLVIGVNDYEAKTAEPSLPELLPTP